MLAFYNISVKFKYIFSNSSAFISCLGVQIYIHFSNFCHSYTHFEVLQYFSIFINVNNNINA